MDKEGSRGECHELHKRQKGGGTCSRVGRRVLLLLFVTALVGFSAWTVMLYSFKLLKLQERLDKLEHNTADILTREALQNYVDEHLERLVEEVS